MYLALRFDFAEFLTTKYTFIIKKNILLLIPFLCFLFILERSSLIFSKSETTKFENRCGKVTELCRN